MFSGLSLNRYNSLYSSKLYLSRQRRLLIQQNIVSKVSLDLWTGGRNSIKSTSFTRLARLWSHLKRLKTVLRFGRNDKCWYSDLYLTILYFCAELRESPVKPLGFALNSYNIFCGRSIRLKPLKKPKSTVIRVWAWSIASSSLLYLNILPKKKCKSWRLSYHYSWY